jgi:hypothetical protein
MTYQRQLTKVKIRLSNDEEIHGDIIDQDDTEFIVKDGDGAIWRVMRGAVVYVREFSGHSP